MAKMSTYGSDSTISLTDRLFGVDAEDSNNTKNYVVSELITFIGSNLPASLFQADGITYDNTASVLVATDVQAAIDELDADIELVDGDVSTNTLAIDGLTSVVDANVILIGNNASAITGLDSSKRDALSPGTNLTSDFNISSLTADEYSTDDGGGGRTIIIDDAANTLVPLFGSKWVHYVHSGAGANVGTSGSQGVVGNISWTATGSYRFTKIAVNSWIVS